MLISIAIPCYKSAKTISDVVHNIDLVFQKNSEYDYEVILVNDGSPDNTFEVIHHICQNNDKVTGVNLSKNFGQSAAKMAAIPYVNGSILVYMDDDGQHPAEGIFSLVDKVREGYDIVYAHFANKKHSLFKRITSSLHNWILYKTGSKPKDIQLSSFFALSSFSIETMKNSECPVIAVAAYLRKLTTKITNIEMPHLSRNVGRSGYTLKRLFDLWSKSITSFNTALLRLAMNTGIFCGFLGVLGALLIIIRKLLHPSMTAGYASLMVVMLVLCGAIMFLIGIVGEYIGKMYLILCKLPPYKIRDVVKAGSIENTRIVNADEERFSDVSDKKPE